MNQWLYLILRNQGKYIVSAIWMESQIHRAFFYNGRLTFAES